MQWKPPFCSHVFKCCPRLSPCGSKEQASVLESGHLHISTSEVSGLSECSLEMEHSVLSIADIVSIAVTASTRWKTLSNYGNFSLYS